MRTRAFPALFLVSIGLSGFSSAACSSDSLGAEDGAGATSDGGDPDSETGGAASGGRPGSGGTPAATGGRPGSGGTPAELPDYTDSPCYGELGQTLVYNGETHVTDPFTATCRGETERVRLYVADELFGDVITQEQVNGFLHRYELFGTEGSYRPELGVLPTDEAVFGELEMAQFPDQKLPIFVIDTKDAGEGYLCGWCETLELHLDGTRLTPLDGDAGLSIAAHETFHAVHQGYDPDEAGWVDESLAQAAMSANGYYTDRAQLNDFARRPNVNWGPGLDDVRQFNYGAGLAFGTYLWELGGAELMQAITAAPGNAWTGLDAALKATGRAQTGTDAFLDMAVALWLDDPERGYGFRAFNLVSGVGTTPLDASTSGMLEPYGLVYYALGAGVGSVRVEGGVAIQARLVGDADPVELTEVELGAEISVPGEGRVLILSAFSSSRVSYTVSVP